VCCSVSEEYSGFYSIHQTLIVEHSQYSSRLKVAAVAGLAVWASLLPPRRQHLRHWFLFPPQTAGAGEVEELKVMNL
jgi:hypothetical protein